MSEKPSSERAEHVRMTCSMQGEKQHIRAWRSRCSQVWISELLLAGSLYPRLTRIARFACSRASQGAGRSRKTGGDGVSERWLECEWTRYRLTCVHFVLQLEARLVDIPVLDLDDIGKTMLGEFDSAEMNEAGQRGSQNIARAGRLESSERTEPSGSAPRGTRSCGPCLRCRLSAPKNARTTRSRYLVRGKAGRAGSSWVSGRSVPQEPARTHPPR